MRPCRHLNQASESRLAQVVGIPGSCSTCRHEATHTCLQCYGPFCIGHFKAHGRTNNHPVFLAGDSVECIHCNGRVSVPKKHHAVFENILAGVKAKVGQAVPVQSVDEPVHDEPVHATATHNRGLVNLGNTCFFNASLQALASFGSTISDIQPEGPIETCLTGILSELNPANAKDAKRPLDPTELLDLLSKTHSEYKKRRQQDAHDLMLRLLDQCPNVKKLFRVVLEWRVRCMNCRTVSMQREETVDLSLSLQQSSQDLEEKMARVTLDDAVSMEKLLTWYQEPVTLNGDNQYHCDQCRGLQDGQQTVRIESTSECLLVHLQRYSRHDCKDDRPLRVQEGIFVGEMRYKLRGVVVHLGGSLNYGHYVAYTVNRDSVVYSSDTQVRFGAKWPDDPYLLVYELAQVSVE